MDSWAVDYGLLADGRLLGNPYHYRDARTERGVAAVHERMPHSELYARNGPQFLPFNTLYQLAAEPADLLAFADSALLIPDLFGFWLTGQARAEQTNASTTGLLHAGGGWDESSSPRWGCRAASFPRSSLRASDLGALRPEVAGSIGASPDVAVTAVGSHDTASAVLAVPMRPDAAAYISCGTWGLVGVEVERPVLTAEALAANFTNEGGVEGRTRLLSNIMGLWVLSEAVRTWERAGHPIDLPTLLDSAEEVTGPVRVFDVNDPRFLAPGDMPSRIDAWCTEHGLAPPRTRAEYARSIVESLAQAFADAAHEAGRIGRRRCAHDPHRRRGLAQRAALPADRRPGWLARAGRPRRGHRARQRADPGSCARRRDRLTRGPPRSRRAHPRSPAVRAARMTAYAAAFDWARRQVASGRLPTAVLGIATPDGTVALEAFGATG